MLLGGERERGLVRLICFIFDKLEWNFFAQTLGRKLEFKDCARRVAFTKLANDPRISDKDAAKYMHVNKKTLSVYHETDEEAKWRAADILSKPMYKPQVGKE